MSGAVRLLPPVSSWHGHGQLFRLPYANIKILRFRLLSKGVLDLLSCVGAFAVGKTCTVHVCKR